MLVGGRDPDDPGGKTRFLGSCMNARWSKLAYWSPSLGGRGGGAALLLFWAGPSAGAGEAEEELEEEESERPRCAVRAAAELVLAARVGVSEGVVV